jgi:transketolase
LIDSGTMQEKRLTREELEAAARWMRALDVIGIHAAGSGHPGGTLSIMDITAALYLNEARLDPRRPRWEGRDRIFFSTGHKAPAIYCALAAVGLYAEEEVVTLRKLGSPFQGHPHAPALPGLDVSSGSLGQGLGIAVGCALAGRLGRRDYRVYCIMGDGEQQEGSIWEAAMAAGHYRLDNLCAIVDRNGLQIDGKVEEVMGVEPLADKYRAFRWNVLSIDGHDMGQILRAFAEARTATGRPTVIIADTVKGKGVSFMEGQAGWHGVATKGEEQLAQALRDIGCPSLGLEQAKGLLQKAAAFEQEKRAELSKKVPRFDPKYGWNRAEGMQVEMDPTRFGFGRCLAAVGGDPRIVTLHADISGSIKITDFEKDHPERLERVFSVGIAEQNMMQVAAGLALEGRIPITGTYGVFAAGRPWDQIRTTICYDNLNVKIAGAHGGISVGADGATHQALEEIALMAVLPNMHLFVPCDSLETERLSRLAILEVNGPAYIRFAREATPVVTDSSTPLLAGRANVIRYRQAAPRFKDAFQTTLASDYHDGREDLCLAACGPMVAEAMRAAWILKEEHGIETRILNIHTVKPIDEPAIERAVKETGALVTCEEHQVGGFGNIVAGAIASRKAYATPFLFDRIGVPDRFGESGGPWELMDRFGLSAEYIAERALALLERKRAR